MFAKYRFHILVTRYSSISVSNNQNDFFTVSIQHQLEFHQEGGNKFMILLCHKTMDMSLKRNKLCKTTVGLQMHCFN